MSIKSRIDNVTKIPETYLNEMCPPPKSAKLELTSTCNLRCSFCTKSIHNTEDGAMDRTLYSRIIRDLHASGVRELGLFFIGESFTCDWLPEAIKEAKEVGFPYVFLTTNGTAAHPRRVRECMEAGLDSLKFSLNFYSAEQMQEVAQVSPSHWRKAIDNFKMARKVRDEGKFSCGLYASSIAFDGEQGERMKAVMGEIELVADETYWLPLYGMDGAAKASGFKPKPGNPGRLEAMREPIPCWSAFTEMHIKKDGVLSACCFGGGSAMDMADLKEVSVLDGWNSLKYQELRRSHLSGDVTGTPCQECAAG